MAAPEILAVTRRGIGPARTPGLGDGDLTLAIATALILAIVIQIGMIVKGAAPVFDGVLVDPDGYMRLSRVLRLWETGAWFAPVEPRINPPVDFALHWTRPLDALLLAGAWLAKPFLGFEQGLFWVGAVLSPVLQAVSLFALIWAAAPVLPRSWRCFLAFFFVSQPGLFAMFVAGRPDHHSLLILLFIVLMGLTIRLLTEPSRWRTAIWAGVVAAGAMWVSVESILVALLSIAGLGLFWLLGERRLARVNLIYGAAILAALVAAVLLERGTGMLSETEIDRVSIAHLGPFAVNLVFWAGLDFVDRRWGRSGGVLARGCWAGMGVTAALAVLWLWQPGFFANPLAATGEVHVVKYLSHIEELLPLTEISGGENETLAGVITKPIIWLGIAVLAIPWLLRLVLVSSGPERRVWVFFALGAVLFTPLGLAQLRWVVYPELFLLVPYAALAGSVTAWLSARLPELALSVVRPLLIAGFCVWFYLPAAIFNTNPSDAAAITNAVHCPVRTLAPVLNDPAGLGAAPKRVLAFVDFGPELLYRTRHSVFAIPNHRPQPGFAAGYNIMTARDFAWAEAELRRAGADLVLICPSSAEVWFYDDGAGGRTLYQALSAGDVPGFLTPVPLPGALAQQFRLFIVR